jgi:CBS domain-containing protein
MRIERLYPMTSARLRVITVAATLEAAASMFANPGVGLLVISARNGKAEGVLSKSDLVRHLTDREQFATIEALMNRNIIACSPADDLQAAWQTMVDNKVQNIPVLGPDTRPVGVLDVRDAMKVLFEQEQLQEQMLANYVAGIGY